MAEALLADRAGWNAPLRREMRTQAITFGAELDRVKIPDPPWCVRLRTGYAGWN
jgi:hypothetical protein